MTEKEIEEKANEIRKDEVARLLFCADVGITEDEFFVARNGDFEIEDMIRAFERGKQSRDCNCMTYLNFKDLEEQIEKMKCCQNCNHWLDDICQVGHYFDCKHNSECGEKDYKDYWEFE
jgi:hypothetical protein